MTCSTCNGPLELLGVLGNREHFRCRDCGMDSSRGLPVCEDAPRHLQVTPAYGRDYTTAKSARTDWLAEKDFMIADRNDRWYGKPVNRQQVINTPVVVHIRFNKNRDTCLAEEK